MSDIRQLPCSRNYPETADCFQMKAVGRPGDPCSLVAPLDAKLPALSGRQFLFASRPHGGSIAVLHGVR